MADHLAAKGFDEATIAATLDELVAQGYVDDARFARLFVSDKRELDGWGSERITRALRERGIDRELVAAALAGHAEGADTTERERALAILERRFPVPPQDRREQERAFSVLLRKGYDSEVALDAVRAHAAAG